MDESELREIIFDRLKQTPRVKYPNRVSISELCWCVRQHYFARFHSRAMSLKDCLRMARGNSLHSLILKFGEKERHIEIYDKDLTVSGYIDVVLGTTVIEFKTVKSFKGIDEYARQLRYYMAMMGLQRGFVVMHNIFSDKLEIHKYRLSRTALKAIRRDLLDMAHNFKKAVETKNPKILPKTYADGFCETCKYRKKCETYG